MWHSVSATARATMGWRVKLVLSAGALPLQMDVTRLDEVEAAVAATVDALRSWLCQASRSTAWSRPASHLTRCLAVEWGQHGIAVNVVAPTFIRTPGTEPALRNPSSAKV